MLIYDYLMWRVQKKITCSFYVCINKTQKVKKQVEDFFREKGNEWNTPFL